MIREQSFDTPVQPLRQALISCATLALVCLAVFFPVLTADFVSYDDNVHIFGNPFLGSVTWPHVLQFWQHPYESLYIPVSYTIFAFLALIARRPVPIPGSAGGGSCLDPHIFHAASLIVHILNVLLVFSLLRRVSRSNWSAAAGALLFAIHPLQVESVAWASELRGLLAAFFGLAAWRIHEDVADQLAERLNGQKSVGMKIRLYVLGATALFGIGLLAKPSIVIIPLMIFAFDFLALRRPARDFAPLVGVWLVLSVMVLILTRSAQSVPAVLDIAFSRRLIVAGNALAFYTEKLVWPTPLTTNYSLTPSHILTTPGSGFVAASVGIVLIALTLVAKRYRTLYLASLLFLFALLPVLGLVPFIFQVNSTVADRYVYLALLGPGFALACGLSASIHYLTPPIKRIAVYASVAVLLLLACGSSTQVQYWQNDYALFNHALAVNPNDPQALSGMGVTLIESGNQSQAEGVLVRAVKLSPNNADTWFNLAWDEQMLNHPRLATAAYLQTISLSPNYATAYFNLGMVYQNRGQDANAIAAFRSAIRIQPSLAHPHELLGLAFLRQGDTKDGVPELQKALQLDPRSKYARAALASLQQR